MDTSSNPRLEWYEEYPEPEAPEGNVNITDVVVTISTRRFGKSMAAAAQAAAALAEQEVKQIGSHLHSLVASFTPDRRSDYTLFPPPLEESVRDRALRLKQQPHSMAQDPYAFHFDHRGRRRY